MPNESLQFHNLANLNTKEIMYENDFLNHYKILQYITFYMNFILNSFIIVNNNNDNN